MEIKNILVIGGSGYIGKEIVSELVATGFKVTILSRKPIACEQIRILRGDIRDRNFLMHVVREFDVVICLAAVIRSIRKSEYNNNIEGLKNIINAMQANGVKRLIYFSTQNVYLKKTGPYGNSKKRCEELVLASNLDHIIVRPNYVYGLDTQNDFYRLINIIRKTRLCPIIGKGIGRFQPVNKKDVAKITAAIVKDYPSRPVIDISGRTTLSISEVADFLREKMGVRFLKIHVPLGVLKLFKTVVPFDVEGFDDNRLCRKENLLYKAQSDFKEDLLRIMRLGGFNRQSGTSADSQGL